RIVYDSLNEQAFKRFPELRQPCYAELIIDVADGPYIVFGTLFNRYLIDVVGADREAAKRAASFIEEMLLARDERVSDMLSIEVLPTFLKSQTILDSYWPLLGAATRHRLRCLPSRFSRKVELPPSE
ncbi:MAG: hypothetical protein V4587_08225, partial [Acidobacteriota bacterium]